jgi:hypothetical protein
LNDPWLEKLEVEAICGCGHLEEVETMTEMAMLYHSDPCRLSGDYLAGQLRWYLRHGRATTVFRQVSS